MTEPVPTREEMKPLFLAALQDSRFQHFSFVWKFDKRRRMLMRLHQDLLIKLLRKNSIAFYWNDGDDHAEAMLVPVKSKPGQLFKNIDMKFPPAPTFADNTAAPSIPAAPPLISEFKPMAPTYPISDIIAFLFDGHFDEETPEENIAEVREAFPGITLEEIKAAFVLYDAEVDLIVERDMALLRKN